MRCGGLTAIFALSPWSRSPHVARPIITNFEPRRLPACCVCARAMAVFHYCVSMETDTLTRERATQIVNFLVRAARRNIGEKLVALFRTMLAFIMQWAWSGALHLSIRKKYIRVDGRKVNSVRSAINRCLLTLDNSSRVARKSFEHDFQQQSRRLFYAFFFLLLNVRSLVESWLSLQRKRKLEKRYKRSEVFIVR